MNRRCVRLAGAAALVLLPTLAGACAGAAPAGDGDWAPAPRGMYSGTLSVGRQQFTGALSLRTDSSRRVRGSFRVVAPLRIDGSVRGQTVDDLLRITITYRGADGCESRIEGILSVGAGGDALEGPVTVHDCGNEVAGSMSFGR